MEKESHQKYIDFSEPKEKIDENEAHKLYEEMCGKEQGMKERPEILTPKEFLEKY